MLQGEVNDKEENVQQNGKRDFVQTLKYFPDPKHNGHDIKCVVEHSAYTEATLNERRNEVSRKLELYCKFIKFLNCTFLNIFLTFSIVLSLIFLYTLEIAYKIRGHR